MSRTLTAIWSGGTTGLTLLDGGTPVGVKGEAKARVSDMIYKIDGSVAQVLEVCPKTGRALRTRTVEKARINTRLRPSMLEPV